MENLILERGRTILVRLLLLIAFFVGFLYWFLDFGIFQDFQKKFTICLMILYFLFCSVTKVTTSNILTSRPPILLIYWPPGFLRPKMTTSPGSSTKERRFEALEIGGCVLATFAANRVTQYPGGISVRWRSEHQVPGTNSSLIKKIWTVKIVEILAKYFLFPPNVINHNK